MSDPSKEYHLAFRAGEITLELSASGIDGATWAQITRAVHAELCKPTAIITLPNGLSSAEAEDLRKQWIAERQT